MSEQLFRFSILRAPEPASELSPIVVQAVQEHLDDQLAGVAAEAVSWLTAEKDLPTSKVADLRAALDVDPARWDQPMLAGLVALAKHQFIAALRGAASDPTLAARRDLAGSGDFLTAAVLLSELAGLDAALPLQEWITTHPIRIDFSGIFPANTWRPKAALSREPAVCDHFVVRETLVGYEMGQIEDIKNYLKGELKNHSLRYLTVNEEETTTEVETEENRTTETATQQRNSMTAASQKAANSTVGLDARVKTEGQYGPTKVSTDVGFQYSSTKNEASQTAAEFSTEVLSKSVEEVKERELKRVVRRSRTELEEIQDHKVDNVKGAAHTVGIYRWVDSVWKATTYGIGLRLVLEFLIPEPGRNIEQAGEVKAKNPEAQPPALPVDLFNTLTSETAATHAATYGADGIKAQPDERQVIGVPFGTTDFKDASGERVMAVVVKDVKIPENYIGEAVFVAVTSMERADVDVNSNVVIDIPGAKPAQFLENPAGPSNPFIVDTGVGRPNPQVRTLILESKSAFGPGSTVPVTVYAEDVRGLAGVVEVHCRLTDAARNQWKLETIEKISGAYRARLAEWQSRDRAQSFEPPAPRPQPDLDALCRHACISSMLNGWPSTVPTRNDANGWPKPGALAGKTGELIEFMEQAFEWSNLQYVAYPYYWADSARWPTLLAYDNADPHVREFVRSGAVRMVVPVRLDLSEAVLFFLATGIPWFGAAAPIPGEPGYVAIADEIRSTRIKDDPQEKVVGEYRYTLPTSLTILQESGTLPANLV